MSSPSAPHRIRRAHKAVLRVAGTAGLVALSACYDGDFFDRLVDADVVAAFRITELTLVDPHLYNGAPACKDALVDFNAIWNNSLAASQINPILLLSPLDPGLILDTKLQLIPATCTTIDGSVSCMENKSMSADIVEAKFTNSLQGGVCGDPVMGSLNPDYVDPPNVPLNDPPSPCLLSAQIPELKLPLDPEFKLPLSNVLISATYALEPEPQRLVNGLIVGFLPKTVAQNPTLGALSGTPFVPWSFIAGGLGCDTTNPPTVDDVDTLVQSRDGVWMYFNFTAERVDWSSDQTPVPTPP